MDSVDRKSVTPSKSRLARTLAKVLHIRAATGIAPVDGIQKSKSDQKPKSNKQTSKFQSFDGEDEKLQHQVATEAFMAKLFASISAIKAAYAQLQFSQSPYDVDGIQAADQMVVSELKYLSELKQCYLKKQLDESSPETSLLLADSREQKCLLRTFEITGKKLDSQLRLKDSEITFLKEKLEEVNGENKMLEKRLNSSGLLSVPDTLDLSGLNTNHFVMVVRQTIKHIRSFVRLMISEMEETGWDVEAAANAIEPGVVYQHSSQKCFAFESFVCREMFDGFNYPGFAIANGSLAKHKKQRRLFFDRFNELRSFKTRTYLAQRPKSTFAKFCSSKYLRLIHPKLELSLFGNLNERKLVTAGEHPENTFFWTFVDMAKRVWLLHCLAFSFQPEASIFQAAKGCRFSDVYMECVNEEAFFLSEGSTETNPLVAFTVVPGFNIGKTIIQCQVYLSWSQNSQVPSHWPGRERDYPQQVSPQQHQMNWKPFSG